MWLSLRDIVLGREAGLESARAGEAGVIPCSRVSGTGGSWAGERAPGLAAPGWCGLVFGATRLWIQIVALVAHHGEGTESLTVDFITCL